jgi:hypothetical protein
MGLGGAPGFNEGVVLLAIGATMVAAAIAAIPRCPECRCYRTVPDSSDPALRHCRRCQTVFQVEPARPPD